MEWYMDNDNQVESTLVEAKRHFLNVKIDDDTPSSTTALKRSLPNQEKTTRPMST
jgi:hypothetical protein